MPGFRGRFRRRGRRFRAPGKAPGGAIRKWVPALYSNIGPSQTFGTNEFVDLFELVSPAAYTSDFNDVPYPNAEIRQYATVVRVVGRLQPDILVAGCDGNGILYSAAVFVRDAQSVADEFAAGAMARYAIHPEATIGNPELNLNRLQPMAWLPWKSYSGAFQENPCAVGVAACSEFFATTNLPGEQWWDFDIKQRRKMQTPQSLWLLVSGVFLCPINDGNPVRTTVFTRTLIHDQD